MPVDAARLPCDRVSALVGASARHATAMIAHTQPR